MDPQATLLNALNDLFDARNPAFSAHRRQESANAAAEALHDLAFWLEKGGFAPEVTLVGPSNDAGFTVRGPREDRPSPPDLEFTSWKI